MMAQCLATLWAFMACYRDSFTFMMALYLCNLELDNTFSPHTHMHEHVHTQVWEYSRNSKMSRLQSHVWHPLHVYYDMMNTVQRKQFIDLVNNW
jgi:hypothetical protein